jgi:hypothetical protein
MRFYIQLEYVLLLFLHVLYIPIINREHELLSTNIYTIDKNKYNYILLHASKREKNPEKKNFLIFEHITKYYFNSF